MSKKELAELLDPKELVELLIAVRQELIHRGYLEVITNPDLLTSRLLDAILTLDPSLGVKFMVHSKMSAKSESEPAVPLITKQSSLDTTSGNGIANDLMGAVKSEIEKSLPNVPCTIRNCELDVTSTSDVMADILPITVPAISIICETINTMSYHIGYRSLLPENIRNQPRPNKEIDWDRFEKEAIWYDHKYGVIYIWISETRLETFVADSAKVTRDSEGYIIYLQYAILRAKESEIIKVVNGKVVHDKFTKPEFGLSFHIDSSTEKPLPSYHPKFNVILNGNKLPIDSESSSITPWKCESKVDSQNVHGIYVYRRRGSFTLPDTVDPNNLVDQEVRIEVPEEGEYFLAVITDYYHESSVSRIVGNIFFFTSNGIPHPLTQRSGNLPSQLTNTDSTTVSEKQSAEPERKETWRDRPPML